MKLSTVYVVAFKIFLSFLKLYIYAKQYSFGNYKIEITRETLKHSQNTVSPESSHIQPQFKYLYKNKEVHPSHL